ncbi:MAG: hypothetical protein WC371_01275 [Parachlamydiales bacterium]|jgi:hypothetical protein
MVRSVRFFLFGLALAGLPFSFFAVLPPFFQSKEEIKAILDDPRLEEILGSSETILNLRRHADGYWLSTPHERIRIKVSYRDTGLIGSHAFELEFFHPALKNR